MSISGYIMLWNNAYDPYTQHLTIMQNKLNTSIETFNNSIHNFLLMIHNPNFGDGVGDVFWNTLIGKPQNYSFYNTSYTLSLHYLTMGSILYLVSNNSIVFGAGFMSQNGDLGGRSNWRDENAVYAVPYKVIAVRGPLSRQKLLNVGIYCPPNYGDPAVLFPCIYDVKTIVNANIVGIIPHYVDKDKGHIDKLVNDLVLHGYTVKLIDIMVGKNYIKLINEINECKYIISSSLHGVIMGVVYLKKTIWIEFKGGRPVAGKGFKFHDFFASINVKYSVKNIYNVSVLDNFAKVDYNNVVKMGSKLIKIAPMIDSERKHVLVDTYNRFYHNHTMYFK
eukprot:444161_1